MTTGPTRRSLLTRAARFLEAPRGGVLPGLVTRIGRSQAASAGMVHPPHRCQQSHAVAAGGSGEIDL